MPSLRLALLVLACGCVRVSSVHDVTPAAPAATEAARTGAPVRHVSAAGVDVYVSAGQVVGDIGGRPVLLFIERDGTEVFAFGEVGDATSRVVAGAFYVEGVIGTCVYSMGRGASAYSGQRACGAEPPASFELIAAPVDAMSDEEVAAFLVSLLPAPPKDSLPGSDQPVGIR
jgi:hypothetical protein